MSRSKVITCDTPSHAIDHLYQIWNESILNCRCYRADTKKLTDRQTDRQSDGQTDRQTGWIQYTPPPPNFDAGGIIIERRCDMVCKCVCSYKFAVEPDIGWCWQYLQCSYKCQFALTMTAGATFQYKDRLSQIWYSHGNDKTVARPSIINMGILLPVRRHIYIVTAPDWEPYDIVKR